MFHDDLEQKIFDYDSDGWDVNTEGGMTPNFVTSKLQMMCGLRKERRNYQWIPASLSLS